MSEELEKEPIEEQLESIIKKKTDENAALQALLEKLEENEKDLNEAATSRNKIKRK